MLKKGLKGIFEVVRAILIVVISAVLIRMFVFQPFVVDGASMDPTLANNEYILTEKVSYRFNEPKRGDIIVFKYPNNVTINYIKRVIGLPGEEVKIFEGNFYINDKKLTETYVINNELTYVNKVSQDQPYIINLASDEYFVMGDNRSHSSDSREWGALKKPYIIGHMMVVLYPTDKFHTVHAPTY